jgi:hypothetical protein
LQAFSMWRNKPFFPLYLYRFRQMVTMVTYFVVTNPSM